VFDRADAEAKKLATHTSRRSILLLALSDEKGTTARTLLTEQNVSAAELRAALQEVRGSHRVTINHPKASTRRSSGTPAT